MPSATSSYSGTMTDEPTPEFPVVGDIVEPSQEDIRAGRFGNGAWALTDSSVQEAQTLVHEAKKALADEREKFFHEEAKDALKESIEYHRRIVRMGDNVLDKIEANEAPSRAEMAVLSQAQKSSSWLADRGIGKPKQVSERTETKTLLSALLIKDER